MYIPTYLKILGSTYSKIGIIQIVQLTKYIVGKLDYL